jgi:hypothetical protein
LNIDIVEPFSEVAVCAAYRCSTGVHCNKKHLNNNTKI